MWRLHVTSTCAATSQDEEYINPSKAQNSHSSPIRLLHFYSTTPAWLLPSVSPVTVGSLCISIVTCAGTCGKELERRPCWWKNARSAWKICVRCLKKPGTSTFVTRSNSQCRCAIAGQKWRKSWRTKSISTSTNIYIKWASMRDSQNDSRIFFWGWKKWSRAWVVKNN